MAAYFHMAYNSAPMANEQSASTKQQFELSARAAGFVCVAYASDAYKGPAVKCLLEQVEKLEQATNLKLRFDQWDERFVMVFPEEAS
jgi:hypothetical protein